MCRIGRCLVPGLVRGLVLGSVVGSLALALSSQAAESRTWTDKKGKQFEAELIEVKGVTAQFKLANGKTIKKQIAALSDEDQELLKQQAEMPDEASKSETKKPALKKSAKKKPPAVDAETAEANAAEPARPAKSSQPAQSEASGKAHGRRSRELRPRSWGSHSPSSYLSLGRTMKMTARSCCVGRGDAGTQLAFVDF